MMARAHSPLGGVRISQLRARLPAALGWRIRRLIGDRAVDRSLVRLARIWRSALARPQFVGIAGTAGKTTSKELLLGILSRARSCTANPSTMNMVGEVAKTILGTRPAHDFCIAELSEHAPGSIDEPLSLLRPSVGIITVLGDDHLSAFSSRDAIAQEISKLATSLPATGTAVLNADDPLIAAMANHCRARILTYGLSSGAELRAENVRSVWPGCLEFVAVYRSQRVQVRTRLCGTHWVHAVLAAIGGGLAAGLSLEQCAQGIVTVAPFEGRMQPVHTPDGVSYLRDDFKAPLWSVETSFDFIRGAEARRKIIVIGTISDCGPGTPQKHAMVARQAQQFADETIFVGPLATSVLKAKDPSRPAGLRVFGKIRDAAEYLGRTTRSGDLVLLKGTNPQDHLVRLILHRTGEIACWRDDCNRIQFCGDCPDRMRRAGAPGGGDAIDAETKTPDAPRLDPVGQHEIVIVGLGNSEERYKGTPHNVGFEVVERLAESMRCDWSETPEASVARGTLNAQRICLLKVRTMMNLTGPHLVQLSERMSFGPRQCILVFDDLDTPLGAIRTRLSGGAGGHRGVASILEAFQTDTIARVKLGVGTGQARHDRARYVLTSFEPSARVLVEQAVNAAAKRAIEVCIRLESGEYSSRHA